MNKPYAGASETHAWKTCEKRRNDTHQSTTDPESVLYRKVSGQAARLCFGGHVLMENRNDLYADFTLHNPITEPEPVMALQQADTHAELYGGVKVKTLGADNRFQHLDHSSADQSIVKV